MNRTWGVTVFLTRLLFINPIIYAEISIRFTSVDGVLLLTRDGKRYKSYFPTLNLIAP